jgi:hypothetical protein
MDDRPIPFAGDQKEENDPFGADSNKPASNRTPQPPASDPPATTRLRNQKKAKTAETYQSADALFGGGSDNNDFFSRIASCKL